MRLRSLVLGFGLCAASMLATGCGGGGDGGAAGSGGSAGSGGGAGTTGTAGSGGTTGAAGAAGTSGAAGNAGSTGTGVAGNAGNAGNAGSTGAAGGAGSGGRGGAAGTGATAGGPGGQGGGSSGGRGGGGGGSGAGGSGGAGAAGRGGGAQDASVPDGRMDDAGAGFMPCPATGACMVLPLGDSITEGYLPSGANGGYRVELFRQAVRAGKNITFGGSQMNGPTTVESRSFPRRHEGRGGYTIDSDAGHNGISGSITDQAIANYRPHIVLLMIGTNDINGNVDVGNAPARLGRLIDDITTDAPAALVVVASIIPVNNSGTNQRVQTYNAALPGLVATRAAAGKHVVFLDNYAAFAQDPNYRTTLMVDSLHPNEAGYAVLGRSFYDKVAALLPAGP
jgi:lysophospholipase L1-like esterase